MFLRLKFRFRGLFAVLFLVVGAGPLLQEGLRGTNLLSLSLTVVLLGALNAVSEGKRPFRTGLLLALPAILLLWASRLGWGSEGLTLMGLVLSSVFIAFIIGRIIAFAMRARRVTSEVLFGALSAYLLIGLLFAIAFSFVELWQPGSLSLPSTAAGPGIADPTRFSTIIYFSYVTLTTLGYGDIGPLIGITRSLVTLEALMGQLFLAVLIARLVALHIVHETEEAPEPDGS